MAGYAPATLYQESRGREMNNTNNYNEPKNNSLKKKRNEYVEKDNLLFVKFSNCDEEFVCDKNMNGLYKNILGIKDITDIHMLL